MAFNGSGVFTRIYNWINDRNNGIKILASRMDTEMDGFATGLTTCITKDGQSTPTANIPLGGFKLTGVGAATAAGDVVNAGQLQGGLLTYYVDTGVADAYVFATSPVVASYVAGQNFRVKITNTNLTTTPTINRDGLGAKLIKSSNGNSPAIGSFTAGGIYEFNYDGTVMQNSTGSGDFSSNTSTSVDGEMLLFSGTGGKTGKRSTLTGGVLKSTSGVPAIAVDGTDYYKPGGVDVAVVDGGSGRSTNTAYAVICGGTTNGGVEQSIASVGSSGQVLTSNGASQLPTFQPISTAGLFTSAQTAIVNAAQAVFTHGLSGAPDIIQVQLVCLTSALGYTAGDVVCMNTADQNFNNSANAGGWSVVPDATNITVRQGSQIAALQIPRKDTGGGGGITPANWEYRIKAVKF